MGIIEADRNTRSPTNHNGQTPQTANLPNCQPPRTSGLLHHFLLLSYFSLLVIFFHLFFFPSIFFLCDLFSVSLVSLLPGLVGLALPLRLSPEPRKLTCPPATAIPSEFHPIQPSRPSCFSVLTRRSLVWTLFPLFPCFASSHDPSLLTTAAKT